MKSVHMNPAEAVQAHVDLGSARSIGIHFGTFQLTDEAIDQPVIDLESEKERRNMAPEAFLALKEGQSMLFSVRTAP
jgi:L-ascorbate metabolism protein UlaG (beta-lactamase superfamily)